MAQYPVRLYINSGFNALNIPDSPNLLESLPESQKLDVDPVFIVTDRGQTQLIVKATKEQVEDVDYCKLGNWYYSAVPLTPLNDNTIPFELNSDGLTSAGGIWLNSSGQVVSRFDVIDGVVSRSTIADDQWGEYTEDDPLCAPQEPLKIDTEWLNASGGKTADGIDGDPIFREATVDLTHQATGEGGVFATTYTDDETGEQVTVPGTVSLPYVTGVGPQKTNFVFDNVKKSRGTQIYIPNDTTVAEDQTKSASQTIEAGTNAIRSLGQENGSIISQWTIPKEFLNGIDIASRTGIVGENNIKYGTDQVVETITGISDGHIASTISPTYATVKNKRVLYGNYNKYGLITCAGNSGEFKPEEITMEATAPDISFKADPRPTGKPYYRFTTINSNTEFWRNALAGSEWENVPLVYQGASGSALTRLNFDNSRKVAELNKSQYEDNYGIQQFANALTIGGGMLSGFSGMATGDVSAVNQGRRNMTQGLVGMFTAGIQQRQWQERYNQQKANELSGLYQSTDVYAPTVNFPYNADILRDTHNNGVLLYKYYLSERDVKRIDKLLTMYGYRHQEIFTANCLYRHTKFDYVACSNVSLTGLPKWWNEEIANQLKNGVRIWHVLPNSDAYNDNPVREGAV